MFTIRYFTPYQQQWRTQSFPTLDEAQRMVQFYLSCGSPAELVSQWEQLFVGFVLILKGGSFKVLVPTMKQKEWLISIHEQDRLLVLWHTEGRTSFLPFFMLLSQNNVKKVLKTIKNVFLNINDLFICSILIVIKRW